MENVNKTDPSHLYLRQIEVEAYKCFRTAQKLSFEKEGKPCMWNVIIGDNGTGKSTILKSIVLCALNAREINVGFKHLQHLSGGENATISLYNFDRATKVEEEFADYPNNLNLKIQSNFQLQNFPLFAYGSYRKSNKQMLVSREIGSQVNTLFDEDANLINAEAWFINADYIDAKTNNSTDNLENVKNLLLKVLGDEVSDIQIVNRDRTFIVEFLTRYGWVPFEGLSSGYRSLITWMVDLTYKLNEFYPDSLDLFNEFAIVLVDEIDLHLHVSLQRKLVSFLTETFPKIQFIVSAHSPLVIQGSEKENIILLEKGEESVSINKNPINVSNWRVDQILTSDLFGLESSRSLEAEKKMKRRVKLIQKDSLDETEQQEMKALDNFINDTRFSESISDDAAMKFIRDAAQKLKANGNK